MQLLLSLTALTRPARLHTPLFCATFSRALARALVVDSRRGRGALRMCSCDAARVIRSGAFAQHGGRGSWYRRVGTGSPKVGRC